MLPTKTLYEIGTTKVKPHILKEVDRELCCQYSDELRRKKECERPIRD